MRGGGRDAGRAAEAGAQSPFQHVAMATRRLAAAAHPAPLTLAVTRRRRARPHPLTPAPPRPAPTPGSGTATRTGTAPRPESPTAGAAATPNPAPRGRSGPVRPPSPSRAAADRAVPVRAGRGGAGALTVGGGGAAGPCRWRRRLPRAPLSPARPRTGSARRVHGGGGLGRGRSAAPLHCRRAARHRRPPPAPAPRPPRSDIPRPRRPGPGPHGPAPAPPRSPRRGDAAPAERRAVRYRALRVPAAAAPAPRCPPRPPRPALLTAPVPPCHRPWAEGITPTFPTGTPAQPGAPRTAPVNEPICGGIPARPRAPCTALRIQNPAPLQPVRAPATLQGSLCTLAVLPRHTPRQLEHPSAPAHSPQPGERSPPPVLPRSAQRVWGAFSRCSVWGAPSRPQPWGPAQPCHAPGLSLSSHPKAPSSTAQRDPAPLSFPLPAWGYFLLPLMASWQEPPLLQPAAAHSNVSVLPDGITEII